MFEDVSGTPGPEPSEAGEGRYYKHFEVGNRAIGAKAILTTEATDFQGIFISTMMALNFISPVMSLV